MLNTDKIVLFTGYDYGINRKKQNQYQFSDMILGYTEKQLYN